jgi:membrane associated rhomboid family serine protease
VFPLRDENPTLETSVATFVIIGLNAAAWVFMQGLGTQPALVRSICKWRLIPGELLGTVAPGSSIRLTAQHVCTINASANWLTPFTSMFLHGGWLHIIVNMWFLTVFGDNVEDSMGRLRFVVFYLLCGLAAIGAQILMDPASSVPMVGASGAIGGVMGAYAVLYPRAPVHLLIILGFWIDRIRIPAFYMLAYWFGLQLISTVSTVGRQGGVAFAAHAGGFLTGVLLVFLFRKKERVEAHRRMMKKYTR